MLFMNVMGRHAFRIFVEMFNVAKDKVRRSKSGRLTLAEAWMVALQMISGLGKEEFAEEMRRVREESPSVEDLYTNAMKAFVNDGRHNRFQIRSVDECFGSFLYHCLHAADSVPGSFSAFIVSRRYLVDSAFAERQAFHLGALYTAMEQCVVERGRTAPAAPPAPRRSTSGDGREDEDEDYHRVTAAAASGRMHTPPRYTTEVYRARDQYASEVAPTDSVSQVARSKSHASVTPRESPRRADTYLRSTRRDEYVDTRAASSRPSVAAKLPVSDAPSEDHDTGSLLEKRMKALSSQKPASPPPPTQAELVTTTPPPTQRALVATPPPHVSPSSAPLPDSKETPGDATVARLAVADAEVVKAASDSDSDSGASNDIIAESPATRVPTVAAAIVRIVLPKSAKGSQGDAYVQPAGDTVDDAEDELTETRAHDTAVDDDDEDKDVGAADTVMNEDGPNSDQC